MKFKGIKKVHSGKYITRYDIEYCSIDNKKKTYEVISRNPDITTIDELKEFKANSVVLIIHNKKKD